MFQTNLHLDRCHHFDTDLIRNRSYSPEKYREMKNRSKYKKIVNYSVDFDSLPRICFQ